MTPELRSGDASQHQGTCNAQSSRAQDAGTFFQGGAGGRHVVEQPDRALAPVRSHREFEARAAVQAQCSLQIRAPFRAGESGLRRALARAPKPGPAGVAAVRRAASREKLRKRPSRAASRGRRRHQQRARRRQQGFRSARARGRPQCVRLRAVGVFFRAQNQRARGAGVVPQRSQLRHERQRCARAACVPAGRAGAADDLASVEAEEGVADCARRSEQGIAESLEKHAWTTRERLRRNAISPTCARAARRLRAQAASPRRALRAPW